jgi:hypothetical protein
VYWIAHRPSTTAGRESASGTKKEQRAKFLRWLQQKLCEFNAAFQLLAVGEEGMKLRHQGYKRDAADSTALQPQGAQDEALLGAPAAGVHAASPTRQAEQLSAADKENHTDTNGRLSDAMT